ncbi:MAG: hypothetical protein M3198_14060, partial [Actinomycetota bacterium]|nr:hypothetical protein [Actinomycetota bacterium]
LSVALAAGRPAWDFPQRPALWSPDFPQPASGGLRPSGRLLTTIMRPHLSRVKPVIASRIHARPIGLRSS